VTGIIFGILFIIGGLAWAVLVLGACSMASRPVANSEGAPALLGVAAIVLGIILIIWG